MLGRETRRLEVADPGRDRRARSLVDHDQGRRPVAAFGDGAQAALEQVTADGGNDHAEIGDDGPWAGCHGTGPPGRWSSSNRTTTSAPTNSGQRLSHSEPPIRNWALRPV